MKVDEVVFVLKILREVNGKDEWLFLKRKDMKNPELGTFDFEEARQFSCLYSINEYLRILMEPKEHMQFGNLMHWYNWKAVEVVEVSLRSHKVIKDENWR